MSACTVSFSINHFIHLGIMKTIGGLYYGVCQLCKEHIHFKQLTAQKEICVKQLYMALPGEYSDFS